jgi:hypothetical protein
MYDKLRRHPRRAKATMHYVPSAAPLALAKGETTRVQCATMKQSRDTDSSEVIDGGNTAIALFAQFYVFDFGLRNGWHVNWLLFHSAI